MPQDEASTQNKPLTLRLATMSILLGVAKSLIGSLPLTEDERLVMHGLTASDDDVLIEDVRTAVQTGLDPLGDAYCIINHPQSRRVRGQTFTPNDVVEGMLTWIKRQDKTVGRLVDPGAGSGRYTLAALRCFPEAGAVAVEIDPVVAVLLRANVAAAGFTERVEIIVRDFRLLDLPRIDGTTVWIGNPPYVRHHDIHAGWKAWYSKTLTNFGYDGSQLAGLHLHFFLKTLELASDGDLGCYVTAAEWLDVKYGQALRQLLTNGLGGQDVFVVDPSIRIFGDAMVSAAITCFAPGSKNTKLHFAEIATSDELRKLTGGRMVDVAVAKTEAKWSFLVKGGRLARPDGFIELGEIFKISRGQVTGLNRVWIEAPDTPKLPGRFLIPTITDSKDITKANQALIESAALLRRLVCLPRELDSLDPSEQNAVDRFLAWAREFGAHETYIARHRTPWWSVSTKEAAPIVMTYMGRRPPVFAINKVGAQIINVAHGLYPRQHFNDEKIRHLVDWLNRNVSMKDGRTYSGGLTKFEPSEAMKILLPANLAP